MYYTGSFAPMMAVIRKKYIRIFKLQKATSPQTAIIPENFGIRKRFIFNRLVSQGVLVAVANNSFYLNQEVEQKVQKKRKKIVLIILFSLVFFAITIYLISK